MVMDERMSPQQVTDLFEELGLAIGGLIAVYEVPEPFIVRLFRNLEEIHCKAVRQVRDQDAGRQEGLIKQPG